MAFFTETWFDSETSNLTKAIKDAGYNLIHTYRENKCGGGVAVIYKDNVKVKYGEASCIKFKSFEYSFVQLALLSKSKVIIVCIYRLQEVPCKQFCND